MKRHSFSLIEIMMALAIIVFGICAVMGLFAVGATSARDASMETYAAHAAEDILHYTKFLITEGHSVNIPNSCPGDFSLTEEELTNSFLWDNYGIFEGTIYKPKNSASFFHDGRYLFVAHHAGFTVNADNEMHQDDSFSTEENIDFRATVQIWKQEIKSNSATGYVIQPADGSPVIYSSTSQDNQGQPAAGYMLLAKVSWPAELPPDQRKSATYTLDITQRP